MRSERAGRSTSGRRAVLLFAVKAVHSAAFFVVQSAIVFLLYKGIRKQTDRAADFAAGVAIAR